jgi:hypothetical protein
MHHAFPGYEEESVMRIVLVTFSVAALAILPMTAARAESDIERAIANGIASNLKESGRLHGYKIGIKMKADTAWLVGQVSSAEQKEAALGIAQESTGVRRVIDKLTVVPRPEPSALRGPSNAPAQAATQVAASLPAAAPELPAMAPPAEPARQPAPPQRRVRTARGQMPVGRPISARSAARDGRMPPAGVNRPVGFMRRQAARQYGGQNGCADGGQYGCAPGMGMDTGMGNGGPMPSAAGAGRAGIMGRGRYDQAALPGYAWPSYAAYPNSAALTYPKQYSPTAWPYIGPFYPYPQVPLGWRKVSLEWDDGWWFLDFNDHKCNQR